MMFKLSKLIRKYVQFFFLLCVFVSISNAQNEKDYKAYRESTLSGLDKAAINFLLSMDLLILPPIYPSPAEHLRQLEKTWENTASRLKSAGIKIANKQNLLLGGGYPRLSIVVSLVDPTSKQVISGFCYSVHIELIEKARLSYRDARIERLATTWQRISIGYGDRDELFYSLLKLIQEMTDQFIIDYLKAN